MLKSVGDMREARYGSIRTWAGVNGVNVWGWEYER